MAEKNLSELSHEELVALAEELRTDLAAKNSELVAKDKELVKVKDELAGTVNINAQLTAELEKGHARIHVVEVKKPSISSETFQVGNIVYGFKKIGVSYKNEVIGAEEVLASETLQQELISIGSGLIYVKEVLESEAE